MRVGVRGELVADLGLELLDLLGQSRQYGDERVGAAGLDERVGPGQAAGRIGQAGVQRGGVGASAVADRGQPPAQSGRGEPVDAVLGV